MAFRLNNFQKWVCLFGKLFIIFSLYSFINLLPKACLLVFKLPKLHSPPKSNRLHQYLQISYSYSLFLVNRAMSQKVNICIPHHNNNNNFSSPSTQSHPPTMSQIKSSSTITFPLKLAVVEALSYLHSFIVGLTTQLRHL